MLTKNNKQKIISVFLLLLFTSIILMENNLLVKADFITTSISARSSNNPVNLNEEFTIAATVSPPPVVGIAEVTFEYIDSGGNLGYLGNAISNSNGEATLKTSLGPIGEYQIIINYEGGISGEDEYEASSTILILEVTEGLAPSFSISSSPTTKAIKPGESTTFIVTMNSIDGFNSPVSLSVTGLPSGTTGSFNPLTIIGSGTSIFTIQTEDNTQTDTSLLTITGEGGELIQTNELSFTVFLSLLVESSEASKTVIAGESATFGVSPSGGTPPYTFKWFEDSNFVPGGTSDHLTITKSSAGSYTFTCEVTDQDQNIATSAQFSLIVNQAPFPLDYLIIAIVLVAAVAALIIYKYLKRPKKIPTPTKLSIKADPNDIIGDGKTKSTIILQLLDKKGNPIAALDDTKIQITATKGKLKSATVTIPKGKDSGKTFLVSTKETGQVPVTAQVERLKSVTITLNFLEKKEYCMHCGYPKLSGKFCGNCGKTPLGGVDTKKCHNCQSIIPKRARFCDNCGAGQ